MGREVRRVPPDWDHPKKWNHYRQEETHKPLLDTPYREAFEIWRNEELPEWLEGYDKWQEGFIRDYANGGWKPLPTGGYVDRHGDVLKTYEEYAGVAPQSPDPKDYMPDWPEEERTHYQMYEDTSEGTPISPVMPDPESLARWLVDNEASAFADQTASYEAWLRVARGGYAPSVVIKDGYLNSGVEALTDRSE